MKYKIEACSDDMSHWSEEYVGNDSEANTFDTVEEAEYEIPELARIFDCPIEHFRVVERR